jgi:hypothetical protein
MNKQLNRLALNPLNQSSLLKNAGRYIGFVTPQLYLILVISLWLAQQAWQKNFETLTTIEAQQSQQREINLQRDVLGEPELNTIIAKLKRLSPRANVALVDRDGQKALSVSVSKAEDLDTFREALLLALSSDEGSIWTAKSLCFGKCEGGPAVAVLTANRQKIEVR